MSCWDLEKVELKNTNAIIPSDQVLGCLINILFILLTKMCYVDALFVRAYWKYCTVLYDYQI